MESVAEAANPPELCGGCSKPSARVVRCAGDRLCEKCRAVIEAALVLLNRGITDEATIIPTLVLAKVAGGSPGYAALAEDEGSEARAAVNIPRLMHEASGRPTDGAEDEYAGWDLADVLDGVPIVRVLSIAVKLEDHPGTSVLKRVELQVISNRAKPEAVRERYEHALAERGAPSGSANNHGLVSYRFFNGFLSMRVSSGDDLDARTVRGLGGDVFGHWAFHFPAPRLVEGFYGVLLGSADSRNAHGFAYALDVYGKALGKSPMRLILAFVAWHVGEGYDAKKPRTLIQDKRHVEAFVDKHVIESLDTPPKNPWLSSRKAGEDAQDLGTQRFVRLYAGGVAGFFTGS